MWYTIVWKIMLNRKRIGSVTEKDLVLASSDYWVNTLKSPVEEMLQMKRKSGQRVRSEGTAAVTVKADSRCQKNLDRSFPSTIDWKPVEKQLRKWCNLVRMGKMLTIEVVLNYRGNDSSSVSVSRTVQKRGRVSAS
ncbi:hypothetical protein N7447_004664 [Penicillium robsamsonii]|uniref:uncharacterized protein n=1 Tax=Penicillium robsamsonii TaxID=1792511 RepID=UPI002547FA72|nr:uncharacterized protein N7447_004664 [Penicillium robsamsonii]KAJ5827901.1 hypothetical protein N7447_004664 [Penicillium robsamsonii]